MTTSKKNSSGAKRGVRLSVVKPQQEGVSEMTQELDTQATAPDAAETPEVAVSVQVKKKDFVERVAARSGTKKPVARNLTEVVLAVLGEALAEGETLIVPPLGRISLARKAGKPGAEVMHLKLKRLPVGEGAKKDKENADAPLAEAEE